jgi:hypothetical protein
MGFLTETRDVAKFPAKKRKKSASVYIDATHSYIDAGKTKNQGYKFTSTFLYLGFSLKYPIRL